MNELVGRLAVKVGIDGAVSEMTTGIILSFLRDRGPTDKVQTLIDAIPGAEAAIVTANNASGLDRLMGGGLMQAGNRLIGLGLSISDIQRAAREFLAFGRDKIGATQMDEIIAGTPGLRQFA